MNAAHLSECRPLPAGYQPTENDIVCGRGRGYYNCAGNVKFRSTVKSYVEYYLSQSTKVEKTAVLEDIVKHVQTHDHAKFVKQEAGGTWCELGDAMAREKAGNAMREAISAYNAAKAAAAEPSPSSMMAPALSSTSTKSSGNSSNNNNSSSSKTRLLQFRRRAKNSNNQQQPETTESAYQPASAPSGSRAQSPTVPARRAFLARGDQQPHPQSPTPPQAPHDCHHEPNNNMHPPEIPARSYLPASARMGTTSSVNSSGGTEVFGRNIAFLTDSQMRGRDHSLMMTDSMTAQCKAMSLSTTSTATGASGRGAARAGNNTHNNSNTTNMMITSSYASYASDMAIAETPASSSVTSRRGRRNAPGTASSVMNTSLLPEGGSSDFMVTSSGDSSSFNMQATATV